MTRADLSQDRYSLAFLDLRYLFPLKLAALFHSRPTSNPFLSLKTKQKKRRRIESFLESMTFPNSIFSPASNNEGEGRNSVPKAAKPLDEGGSSRKTPTIPLIRLECRY